MDTSNIVRVVKDFGSYVLTTPVTKEDVGIKLLIDDIELPEYYQIDFSNSDKQGQSTTQLGDSTGVEIPVQYIKTGKVIYAFYYYVGNSYGKTVRVYRIPNHVRPDRTDAIPEPSQQSVIDQTIAALNTAVEKTAADVETTSQNVEETDQNAARAEQARDRAEAARDRAETAADSAEVSAAAAAQSESNASASASQSAQIKSDIEDMVDDVHGYAQASAQSATASANSATQAQGFANSASASAQSASGYASNAQASANTASSKATEASTSAQTASQKATEASQSVTNASQSAQDAEQAKTDAQTAQGLAESARDDTISAKDDAEDARDEAQSIVDDISGKVEQIDSNTERIESLEDDRYKPYAVDTASGAIASFSDGADDIPLKSLVVNIDPTQDLHGQENPYPAGGGKNLFNWNRTEGTPNPTTSSPSTSPRVMDTEHYFVGATRNNYYSKNQVETYSVANGIVSVTTASGGYGVSFPVKVEENTNYTSSYTEISNAKISMGFYSANWEYIDNLDGNNAGTIKSFTTPANTAYVVLVIVPRTHGAENVAQAKDIQLELGTTATAYAPYENLCPISGWSEVNVQRTGVNVWDEEWEVGRINISTGENQNATGIRSKNYVPVVPSTTYYVKSSSNENVFVIEYDADKNYIRYASYYKNRVYTTSANAHYIRLYKVNVTTYNHDISINYPSTDTDYHPHSGQSINIALGQTVYGGKLDVLSGALTVDRKGIDLSTAGFSYNSGWNCWTNSSITDAAIVADNKTAPDAICSFGVGIKASGYTASHNHGTFTQNTSGTWLLDNNSSTTLTGTLVYKLATPITYQLTPTEVKSLLGQNHVWADSVDTEVEYRADTKLFIERLTAPDSADMVADANITSGQYFMVGNSLYKATANIANGAQIIVGTNCIRKSLSEALNEINA